MTMADERTSTGTVPATGADRPVEPSEPSETSEPSRFSPGHPRSLTAWVRPSVWLPLAVMLAVFAVLWQWGAGKLPYLLPPLPKIGDSLTAQSGYYVDNALVTLGEAMGGLAIGFVAAFALAVLTSELPLVRRAVMPIAVVLNVTPLVAIAPALVVAFGFGPLPKLVIAGLICFFPILINTAAGLRSVPQQVLHVYRTMDAGRFELLRHVRIPNALPFVFAALRIVFPLSIVGAVVAEMSASGSARGLGTAISVASSMNQLPVVYASIFVLALLGLMLLFVVTLVERRVLRWHDSAHD